MPVKTRQVDKHEAITVSDVIAKATQLVVHKRRRASISRGRKSCLNHRRHGLNTVKPSESKGKVVFRNHRIRNYKILEKACEIVEQEGLNISRDSLIICLYKNKPLKNNGVGQPTVNTPILRKGKKTMTLAQEITIPASVTVGNQETKWLNPHEVITAVNNAVKQEIERKKKHGLPIARYDIESQKAYIEYADGTREYV